MTAAAAAGRKGARPPPWVFAACALWVVAFGLLGFPGQMDWDSREVAEQAAGAGVMNWHPVFYAWLWKQTGRVAANPAGMFLLQWAMVLAAALLTARALCGAFRGAAALALTLIAFSPLHLFLYREVLKDTVMTAALVLAASVLLHALLRPAATRAGRAAEVAALLAAAAVAVGSRHNGLFFALPIAFAYGAARHGAGWRRRAAAGAAAAVLTVLATAAATRLSHLGFEWVAERRPVFSLLVFDLAGTFANGPRRTGPEGEWVATGLSAEEAAALLRCYDPVNWDPLARGDCGPVLHPRYLAAMRSPVPMLGAWAAAVAEAPGAYLRHRLAHNAVSLRLDCRACGELGSPFGDATFNPPGAPLPGGAAARAWHGAMAGLLAAVRPWMALVAAALSAALAGAWLAAAWRRGRHGAAEALVLAAAAVCAACLFAYAGLFFVSVASVLRYHYPLYALLSVAAPLLAAGVARGMRARARA